MNIEIKFRAWDKFNEVFYRCKNERNLAAFFQKCQKAKDGGNDIVFLQYTGLKDKNGKEIYEGDICAIDDLYCTQITVMFKNLAFTGISKEHYAISSKGEFPNNGYSLSHYNLEVIGNIYENPELIK